MASDIQVGNRRNPFELSPWVFKATKVVRGLLKRKVTRARRSEVERIHQRCPDTNKFKVSLGRRSSCGRADSPSYVSFARLFLPDAGHRQKTCAQTTFHPDHAHL